MSSYHLICVLRRYSRRVCPFPSFRYTANGSQQTCQYLFDTLLSEPNQTLKSAYVFIWDRTRAIRNDFSIQQLSKISDVRVAIECLEWIARFHILTLHQIGGRPRDGDMDRYDYYQDLEQLDKTLLSLINYYHNVRNHYHSPNEAEFRAYRIIYQITSPTPDVEDNVQLWPAHLLRDPRVQTALKLYDAAQSIRQPQGPLAKRIGHPIAQGNWNRFFKLARSKQTSYLMACVAEIYFNFVRHNALRAIWRAYRTGGEGRTSDGWTLAELAAGLGFDSEDQVRAFVENYNFKVVQKEDGQLRLDVNSVGRTFPSPIVDRQTPQLSMSVVEPKRYGRTSTAIIYGVSVKVALEAGMVEEGYKLKGEHSTSVSVGSLPGTAPSAAVNGSSGGTGFPFSTAAQTSTPTKPPPFAFLNATGAARSEAAQPTLNFNFSVQSANQKEPETRKPKRGGDSLFVTGESDDEDDPVTKPENVDATPATAATPSLLNPFANAFAPASTRTASSTQSLSAPNFTAPSPRNNPFAPTSTSTPPNAFSSSTPSSRSFQFPGAQSAAPATSTSNTFSSAETTAVTKSPVFKFNGQSSTSIPGSSPGFNFPPTPPKSTIDKPPIASEPAQPFAFPSSSASTIAGITIDNTSATPLINSALAPTSSSSQPIQPTAASALALTANLVEQSQSIEERFLDNLAPLLQDVDPNIAARVMDRVHTYILDPELVSDFVKAEKEVARLESLSAQTGDRGARIRILRLVQEARATRAFREDLVRKQYLAQYEEVQRQKKRAAQAEREKSFAHYKGVRTEEVLRYLTRHLAFYPRQPTLGIVPTFHARLATKVFGEVIANYEKESEEREHEKQRIAELERLEREQRRKEKAKEMRARMRKSILREAEKSRTGIAVGAAQDHETAQAEFDAHLEAQRRMPSTSSRPSTAAQHQQHDIGEKGLQSPAATNKPLPRNMLLPAATMQPVTPFLARTGDKRKEDASVGSRNGGSPPTLLDLMSMGPERADKSVSTFRNPYFRLKAAGLLPGQQRAKQKRKAEDDVPYAPLDAGSPLAKRKRTSGTSIQGRSSPSGYASTLALVSSPTSADSSPPGVPVSGYDAQMAMLRRVADDLGADEEWLGKMAERVRAGDEMLLSALRDPTQSPSAGHQNTPPPPNTVASPSSLPSYQKRASRFVTRHGRHASSVTDRHRPAVAAAQRQADWAALDAGLEQETQMALARVHLGASRSSSGGSVQQATPSSSAAAPPPPLQQKQKHRPRETQAPPPAPAEVNKGSSADDAILLD